VLKRDLIFSSDQPILDLIFPDDNPNRIEVLEALQITSYERERDHWVLGASTKLPRKGPIERDLRGQLDLGIDAMSAVFPTEICNLSISDSGSCRPNRGVRLSEESNEVVAEKKSPPWITATGYFSGGKFFLLVAGEDGKLRLFGDNSDPTVTVPDFGDQITSIRTNCSSGWQALVTLRGDRTKSDSVQGVEIRDQKLLVVTQALQFEGPVLALRRSNRRPGLEPSSAIAIVLNLQTGIYEVYRLTLACSN